VLQSKTSKKAKIAHDGRGSKGPVKADKTGLRPKRVQTKQEAVLALLRQPAGATIAAMMKATCWQQHSVRGFLAGVVNKRLKLKLGSTKVDGVRVYRITGGEADRVGAGKARHQPR
jgi:Protein of unknown function (DUF3489)